MIYREFVEPNFNIKISHRRSFVFGNPKLTPGFIRSGYAYPPWKKKFYFVLKINYLYYIRN